MNPLGTTHVHWLVSPAALHTESNLSSMSVITPCYSERADKLGGRHVILLR